MKKVKPTPIHFPASIPSIPNASVAISYPIIGTMKRSNERKSAPPFVPGSRSMGRFDFLGVDESSDMERDVLVEDADHDCDWKSCFCGWEKVASVLVERIGAMVILVLGDWIVKAWHDIAISNGSATNFKVVENILVGGFVVVVVELYKCELQLLS